MIPEWWEWARDAALLGTGIFIGIYMAITHDADPGLLALVAALCGLGAFGRGTSNGKKK